MLSEIIRKNLKYDKRFYLGLNYGNKVAVDLHYPESLLTAGKGVCNAVSAFSSMILNHPDINIETNQCSRKINEEMSHAWNEVKI